ncbi:MAG: LL-diaminopimelate aminotransferase [Candidatus Omnitrophota bacterium]
MELSHRLKKLPPYLFAEIDRAKRKAKEEGRDIIDLGVGDPDLPTPKNIIDKLNEAARDPRNHRYALDQGMPRLREAIANWYKNRFKAQVDPEREILPLIGSKEGIAHLPLAFINSGDVVLLPDPAYPAYKSAVIFSDGIPYLIPLLEKNNFLPDFSMIKKDILSRVKIIYLNYPNNPTAAVADAGFLKQAVEFARQNSLVLCYDNAYSEMSYDNFRSPSLLEIDGAKEVGIEFHSLSKTYNMTGWRIGWAVGNKEIISALAKVKANIDSGIFSAIQVAGIEALERTERHVREMCKIYKRRRDIMVEGLNKIGIQAARPKATFYLWMKMPIGNSSAECAKLFLEKADIVVTPGVGFGLYGEGYIRMALTVPEERLSIALSRIEKIL